MSAVRLLSREVHDGRIDAVFDVDGRRYAVVVTSRRGPELETLTCRALRQNPVTHHEVPWIDDDARVSIEPLGERCWKVMLHFGFMDDPDVPRALELVQRRATIQLDSMETSYFLSRDIVMPTIGEGMALWREKLFAGMHRNAAAAADFLNLPANRVVELGAKVAI